MVLAVSAALPPGAAAQAPGAAAQAPGAAAQAPGAAAGADHSAATAAVRRAATPIGPGNPPYRTIDLGPFELPSGGRNALDSTGRVIGHRQTATGTRAFQWYRGRLTDLGTLGGTDSAAVDINDDGTIVGTSQTGTGDYHAFRWRRGVLVDLGTLGGRESMAAAVNDRGEVVGTSQTSTGQYHAFRWRRGVLVDLGTLGGANSAAADINDRGEVAGTSDTRAGFAAGFRWHRGVSTALHPLSGSYTSVTAINERGHVLGLGSTPTSPANWCLWRAGSVVDTGLDDDNNAWLNDRDQVAGTHVSAGEWRAVLWQRGRLADLPLPAGHRTSRAADINGLGEVVGYSGTGLVQTRPVLWHRGRAVPLPLAGFDSGLGQYLNERGDVAGSGGRLDSAARHGLLWRRTHGSPGGTRR